MISQNSKRRNELYIRLDDLLAEKALDSVLQDVLMQFDNDDFLKMPILFDLMAEQRIDLLKDLYHRGVSFDYTDESGANVLHVASGANGSLEIVKFLYENNIQSDVNALTDEHETPFILAVMYGHRDIVDYFLTYAKPDMAVKTIDGKTAFSLAESNGDFELVSLLKKYVSTEA